jgi:hypothetical protein
MTPAFIQYLKAQYAKAMRITKQKAEAVEDQEDLKLVMERRGGPTTRITLEELGRLSQENNS